MSNLKNCTFKKTSTMENMEIEKITKMYKEMPLKEWRQEGFIILNMKYKSERYAHRLMINLERELNRRAN